jgi:hypothetical protein
MVTGRRGEFRTGGERRRRSATSRRPGRVSPPWPGGLDREMLAVLEAVPSKPSETAKAGDDEDAA